MSEKLKPCPFCGGTEIAERKTVVGLYGSFYAYDIGCTGCDFMSPPYPTEAKAKEWWNTRALAPLPPLVQNLLDLLMILDGPMTLHARIDAEEKSFTLARKLKEAQG